MVKNTPKPVRQPMRQAGQSGHWLIFLKNATRIICFANILSRLTSNLLLKVMNDPWTIDDVVVVTAIQKIWNTAYRKTIICTISTDSPVFAIVSNFTYLNVFFRPNNASWIPGILSLALLGSQWLMHSLRLMKNLLLMKAGELLPKKA